MSSLASGRSSRQSEVQRQIEVFDEIVSDSLTLMQHDICMQQVARTHNWGAPARACQATAIQLQQVIINLIVNACQAMANVHDRDTNAADPDVGTGPRSRA